MRQSKFSLADVLTVLTALAFGFVCFLGKNFSTLGHTYESIIWGVVIAVSLAGTAYITKLLKRTSRNFKTNFILEIIVLLLFTGLMIYFAYSPFPHYFNVSAKKKEIQKKLETSITQAENMFTAYEQYAENRKKNFEGKLDNAIFQKQKGTSTKDYIDCDFDMGGQPDNIQKSNKMTTTHILLFPSNYSDSISKNGIKEVATAWLAKAKTTTDNWKPIGIVNVLNNVEKNSNDWLNKLIGFSQLKEKGDDYYKFPYPPYQLTFPDVKTYFTTSGKPTPLSIGLAVGAYVLMLLSWFVTKRHSRSTGMLTTAPYEVVL